MPLLSGRGTWREVERQRDLGGLAGGEDRSVIGEPFNPMGRPQAFEPTLDALDHHIADHGTAETCGGRNPTDNLAVVAIEHERHPNDLSVPAGELEPVGAPADVRAHGDDPAVMPALRSVPGMPREKQPVLLHQAVDTLGIDRVLTGGSPLALEELGDPPVPVCWPCIDKATNICGQLHVTGGAFAVLVQPESAICPLPPHPPEGEYGSTVGTAVSEMIGDDARLWAGRTPVFP